MLRSASASAFRTPMSKREEGFYIPIFNYIQYKTAKEI